MPALDPHALAPGRALRLAAMVARDRGISEPVEPLRRGTNHVFRAGDVVLRVAPESADVAGQVALARWLAAEGFPVAAPLADPEIRAARRSASGTTSARTRIVRSTSSGLGAVVARLHRIQPARLNGVVPLAFCGDAAWLRVEQRLEAAEAANLVDAEGLVALRQAGVALRGWHERARRGELVVCHGDVHPHNVLMRDDEVVIISWDAICTGPPAWDHAPLMTWAERWRSSSGLSRLRARLWRRPARVPARPGAGSAAAPRPHAQHHPARRERPGRGRRGGEAHALLAGRSRRAGVDALMSRLAPS